MKEVNKMQAWQTERIAENLALLLNDEGLRRPPTTMEICDMAAETFGEDFVKKMEPVDVQIIQLITIANFRAIQEAEREGS